MSTITAAAAAVQAQVTVDTVRAWCRYGAITAVKTAGRWAINAASLTHRIHIGNRTQIGKTRTTPAPAELPVHRRPGVARYERLHGQWTVRITGDVLKGLLADVDAGGERVVTVTKRSGETKRQPLTGRAWKTRKSSSPSDCVYNMELSRDERQGPEGSPRSNIRTAGSCAECGYGSRYLRNAPDSSGIVRPVCDRCGRLPFYQRSYC